MKKIWVIGLLFIIFGCDSKSNSQEKWHEPTSNSEATKLEVVYDGPIKSSEFSRVYNTSCGANECIVEIMPEAAPLKKSTKENLCIIPRHERSAIITAYFSREDTVEGALCEVSKTDYDALIASYGKSTIYKKYLNQRSSEDFLTWKTINGYVTTYKAILGRDPNGNIMYYYYVYIGSAEHRHYSKYVAYINESANVNSSLRNNNSMPSQGDNCEQQYQGWIFNNLIEEGCGFNGGLSEKIGILIKEECQNQLPEEKRNELSLPVMQAVKKDIESMGKEKFCSSNEKQYNHLLSEYYKVLSE